MSNRSARIGSPRAARWRSDRRYEVLGRIYKHHMAIDKDGKARSPIHSAVSLIASTATYPQ